MKLIDSIKKHESFVGNPYEDSLGFYTIGYGTKLPLTEKEAEIILKIRLYKEISELYSNIEFIDDLNDDIKNILFEMSYQLGTKGVLKFKKMLNALRVGDYNRAADEMIDSKWHKQTPSRVRNLSNRMRRNKS